MQDFDPEATHTVGTTQHGETLRDGGASITQIDRSPGAESQDDEEREAQSEPARGSTIGRHLVLRRVGAGAMGVVFAAHDPELDRTIALKVLRPHRDPRLGGVPRLLQEARSMARVSHPNVVTIHDLGEDRGFVYLAMEFVEGQTLSTWRDAKPTVAEIVATYLQAAKGLYAAHAVGLVHRDFKPDNAMIDAAGLVRVMDFGLARDDSTELPPPSPSGEEQSTSVELAPAGLTRTGAMMGTPAYMSPEQHLGKKPGPLSDQFSFCVALWEALHGERPFGGESFAALAFNVTQGQIRDPTNSAVPGWLNQIVRRGLSVNPEDRWPDMNQLALELGLDRRGARRRRLAALLSVGAIVAAAAAGAWWANQSAAQPCAQGAPRVAELSTERLSAELSGAFTRTELSFAEDSAKRSAEMLGTWAQNWSDNYTLVCRATAIEGRQSERALDHRMGCLDRALTQAKALHEALLDADTASVKGSVQALSQLPSSERCVELDPDSQGAPPPELKEKLEQLRERLAVVRARLSLGKAQDAVSLLDELAPDLLSAGESWGITAAEIGLLRGQLQSQVGEFKPARDTLERAYYAAVRQQSSSLTIAVAAELIHVWGHGLGDSARALSWSALAEAWSGANDDYEPSAFRKARIKSAEVLTAQADYSGALEIFSQLEEELEREGQSRSGPTLRFELANATGNAHQAAGDLGSAREAYERAHALAGEAFGPLHPSRAVVMFNLGVLEHQNNEHHKAREAWTRAAELFAKSLGPHHPNVGNAHLNLGNAAQSLRELDVAQEHYAQAQSVFEVSLSPEHPRVADLLGVRANLYSDQGNYEESMRSHERAIEIYVAAHGEEHPDVGLAMFNRGLTRLEREPDAGERDLRRSLEIFERSTPDEHPYRAFAHGGLSDVLIDQKKWSEAEVHLQQALRGEALPTADRSLAQWKLARARHELGKGRAEFEDLCQESVAALGKLGENFEGELKEVDRWCRSVGVAVEI